MRGERKGYDNTYINIGFQRGAKATSQGGGFVLSNPLQQITFTRGSQNSNNQTMTFFREVEPKEKQKKVYKFKKEKKVESDEYYVKTTLNSKVYNDRNESAKPLGDYIQFENKQKVERAPFLSKNKLKEISMKAQDEQISYLIGLTDLKSSIKRTEFTNDMTYLLVSILKNIIDSNSSPVHQIVTNLITNTDFFNVTVKNIINTRPMEENFFIFFSHLLYFTNKIFEKYTSLYTHLPVNDFIACFSYLELRKKMSPLPNCSEKLFNTIQNLNTDILNKQIEMYNIKEKQNQEKEKEEKQRDTNVIGIISSIPIDYREVSAEISNEELLDNNTYQMQPHLPRGDYESYERYFNTLFYLEYEDCYKSLRNSIQNIELTKQDAIDNIERDNRDIYYYINGEIVSLETSNSGLILTLDFEGIKKNIKFTKRMIYGSLLVITDKSFSGFLLGTVSYNPYSMKKHKKNFTVPSNRDRYRVQISLVNINQGTFTFILQNRNKPLQIFESKAYYESYIHVMKRIQSMNTRELPFEEIIIKCNYTNMQPQYLRSFVEEFHGRNVQTFDRFYVRVNYEMQKSVKLAKEFNSTLDDSQSNALDLALKSKVALIQGPPGTGKTHLASILTKIIMENVKSPILVVCYTNHALDQFLAHFIDYTQSIVRIGGRCNDPRLKDFVLNNTRAERTKEMGRINREIYQTGREISAILECIDKTKPVRARDVKQNFPDIFHKIINDYYAQVPYKIKKDLDSYSLEEQIYKTWSGSMKVDDLLMRILYDEFDIEDAWGSLFDFTNENQFINIKKETIIDKEEDDFDDEDELNENEDRLAVEYVNAEMMEENLSTMSIEEETIDLTNIAQLTDKEFEAIFNRGNVWKLGPNVRKNLVYYIKYKMLECADIDVDLIQHFQDLITRRKQLDLISQSKEINSYQLVGMTTTGCAKYATILEQCNFEVVIIEEAAEVLESHVAALLTKHTKHLIMIGDHKQLKPKPYNYEIERKYHFDVSMFERLINNEIPYASLKYQRRMKPLFADFVRLIYGESTYIDHATTKGKEKAKGFESDMFIITHTKIETPNITLASKSNEYEANYIVRLAHYIIQQGYKAEQITILTLYVGQVLLIRKIARQQKLFNVRITSVDNYQGEENDFILLSLVRSNTKKEIGFLKTFNRVCVAFSRAKIGFYIIGNIKCIVEGEKRYILKSKELHLDDRMNGVWGQIAKKAEDKKIIGPVLRLQCQNHNEITEIRDYQDFAQCPEGGCLQTCMQRLPCGHLCEKPCHNINHETLTCRKKCQRVMECGHKCMKMCYEKCAPCKITVTKQLPCGHTVRCLCYQDVNQIICGEPCNNILRCGHKCSLRCGEDCNNCKCHQKVERFLPCGHTQSYYCYIPIEELDCIEPCKAILSCGHPCQGTCGKCLKGTLHIPCTHPCEKELICGHVCKQPCNMECICSQKCMNICPHGSKCQKKCCEKCVDCIEECTIGCIHRKCKKLCHEQCDIRRCNNRCSKKLKCGHQCIGLCGERCPRVCRECDPNNECFDIFFGSEDEADSLFYQCECGHAFEYQGLDTYFDNDKSINMTKCPRCKTILTNEPRYQNVIKERFNDIQKVKEVLLQRQGNTKYLDDSKKIINELRGRIDMGQLKDIRGQFTNLKEQLPICISVCENFNPKKLESSFITTYKLLSLIDSFAGIEYYNNKLKNKEIVTQIEKAFMKNFDKVKEYFLSMRTFTEDFFTALKLKITNMFIFAKINITLSLLTNVAQKERLENMMITSYFASKDVERECKNLILLKETVEIMRGLGTRWYRCPNGHLYAVGECGRPMQNGICPECGARIGGAHHVPEQGNVQVNFDDGEENFI